ncbi:hypothetical protein CsatB_024742 [Cannabis sativa]
MMMSIGSGSLWVGICLLGLTGVVTSEDSTKWVLLSDPPSTPTEFQGSCPFCGLTSLRNRVKLHEPGSPNYIDAKKDLDDAIAEIERENDNFARIANILLNNNTRSQLPQFNKTKNIKYSHLNNCYHSLMDIYIEYCGRITFYASARRNEIDNMCDVRVTEFEMTQASIQICSTSSSPSYNVMF